MREPEPAPQAVVVGLCAHGLAIVRALGRSGVRVLAVESNRELPGNQTRFASVANVGPMNGPGLSETLRTLATSRGWDEAPVLFLTNDRMVRDVAENWALLQPHYRLSWAACRERVLRLMQKENLPAECGVTGVRFPATRSIGDARDVIGTVDELKLPIIVKPSWPLGSFKTRIVESAAQLGELVAEHAGSLPFVAQEWIDGGVESLCFCALYLREGRVVAHIEGRKVYAGPDGLGQATVMETWPDDRVFAAALAFLANDRLSGPVAVEFKADRAGNLWLIEPNIGRTEYCVDVCIANGVNLPVIEYCDVAGTPLPKAEQRRDRTWVDTDRDRWAWLRLISQAPMSRHWRSAIFPYFRFGDSGPFLAALGQVLRRRVARLTGRSEGRPARGSP